MNQLIESSRPLTMSSREIAELTGKEHKNVTRTIESLISGKVLTAQVEPLSYEHRGNWYRFYELGKRDCLVVVARLSPEFTAAIVDRWQELEQESKPKIPINFAEALQLAADQAKALELAAPKIAFVDNLVDRAALMNASQVAQKHKKSAIWLNKILVEMNVYNKAVKRGRVFQQWFIDKGLGEMKQSDEGYSQAMFTNAGEVWINEKLYSEGVV